MNNGSVLKLLRCLFGYKPKASIRHASRQTSTKLIVKRLCPENRFPGFLIASSIPFFFVIKAASKMDQSLKRGEVRDLMERADSLYDDTRFEELLSLLSAHGDCEEPDLLWRLARALYESCRNVKDNQEKVAILEKALGYAEKALNLNENCWAAHKWAAILIDQVWRLKSTKGRILQSFIVRKHMERAIELNPKDSTSYYILGEWCYAFADMPWYQRKAASVIFATPPTSTYEEALEYFEKAENITPLFYSMNLLMMGKCLLNLNEKERAIQLLKQALDYPSKTADDIQAHSEAEELLKTLNAI